MYSGKLGYIRAKNVVILLSRCIQAKMVVLRQKWFKLGKVVVFE